MATHGVRAAGLKTVWAGLLGLFLMLVLPLAAYAADSPVNATLCDTVQTPDVTVTSPVSDSVTDTPTVTLAGTTVRTTQIDVSLNGTYVTSLAIGQQDPSFSTSLTLDTGTNTISLDAYFSCNQNHQTSSVVVTYQPAVHPATGANTNTNIARPGNTGPQTISNPNKFATPEDQPTGNPIVDSLNRIESNLGFDGLKAHQSIVRPIAGWISLITSLVALTLALLPPYYLGSIFYMFGWKGVRFSKKTQLVIRTISAIFAVLFAFFLQL